MTRFGLPERARQTSFEPSGRSRRCPGSTAKSSAPPATPPRARTSDPPGPMSADWQVFADWRAARKPSADLDRARDGHVAERVWPPARVSLLASERVDRGVIVGYMAPQSLTALRSERET